jgi:hypothetical protein
MQLDVKRLRRRLWESMTGCDCPPLAAKEDRCTTSTIRCNGRMSSVCRNFKHYGLSIGPVLDGQSGLDPKAPKAAVARREKLLASGELRP